MDDDPPVKRSLVDDPHFLASLTDLDRGLDPDVGDMRRASQLRATPAPTSSRPTPLAPDAVVRAEPITDSTQEESSANIGLLPPLAAAPGQRRPLLDLFPPPPVGRDLGSGPASDGGVRQTIARRSASRSAPRPTRNAPPPTGDEPFTYETFYGLSEKPFSLSTDPRFLYHSASHDKVAQELLGAIHRRDGLVLVTGEFGAGKTTLCRVVLRELDHRTLTSLVLDPIDSVEELFETVLVDFGVASRADLARPPHVPRAELTATLRSFIASLESLQANAVIIIDEAQALPVDVLQEIPGLAGAGGESRLLQVVLAGQPALVNLLRQPELRLLDEDVAVRSKLGPLARDEIGGYAMHRLGVAGHLSRVEFNKSALTRLHDLSGGVPRVVNLLCDRALSCGHAASAAVIDGALVDAAADDLDLALPAGEKRGTAHLLLTAVVLVALMLVGAGGALWVFQDAVTRTVVQWESVPAVPGGPIPRLPVPLKAIPPPIQ